MILECPNCGRTLDSFKNVYGTRNTPTQNDIGVCAYCKKVHGFDDSGSPAKLTAEQLADPVLVVVVADVEARLSALGPA